MGARGPVPKRSDMRLGHRAKEDADSITRAPSGGNATAPEADPGWHPVALAWYASLAVSGQHTFYEPSDWATAYLIAESISRDLNPQVVGVTDSGKVVTDVIPMKGASLSAYLRAMTCLLVTEGDRRRHQVELVAPEQIDADEHRARGTITDIRARLEDADATKPS